MEDRIVMDASASVVERSRGHDQRRLVADPEMDLGVGGLIFFFLPFFLLLSPKKWRGEVPALLLWGSRGAGAPLDPLLDLSLALTISWLMYS